MPRSGAAARRRIAQAALELYVERGYDATTVADIARRAEVNDRTFFRHFPDKREVLFSGQDELRDALVASLRQQDDADPPLTALHAAFDASAHVLEAHEAIGATRLRIIAQTPALLERDLAKGAAVADALAEALRHRGVPAGDAGLAAAVGWAAFHHAATQWVDAPGGALREFIAAAFTALAGLSAATTR